MELSKYEGMNSKTLVDIITGVPDVIGQIYSDLASPSIRAIGDALGTVFEFSTSFLLPVKLLNEKFKANFTRRLSEYGEKLQVIPEERRCEVHPQIGTPIVEKLTYTTTDEIADLFTSLLATASDSQQANLAHPSFIGIIERLSSDEALIIKYLKGKEFVEYCDIRGSYRNDKGFRVIIPRITLIQRDVKLIFPQNIQAYLSNLESIGIIADQTGLHKVDQSGEEEIMKSIDFDSLTNQLVPSVFQSLSVHRGFFDITRLGQMFISACIK